MKITEYISSILPTFAATRLVEELQQARDQLTQFSIPVYEKAIESVGTTKTSNPSLEALDKQLREVVRDNYIANPIRTIHISMVSTLDTIDGMIDFINGDDALSGTIVRDAITYKQAQVAQYVESVVFYSEFARRLLSAYIDCEADPKVSIHEWKGDGRPLADDLRYFISLTGLMTRRVAEILKEVKELPDTVVTPTNNSNLRALLGNSKLDPFKFGIIPYKWNPVFHVQMWWANHQVNRLKLAREEVKALELKIHYHGQKEKNARTESIIERLTERVRKLRYKISKMEGSHVSK